MVFVLLPFSLSSHSPSGSLDGVGISVVNRTDGNDPRTDEPGMELSEGDSVGDVHHQTLGDSLNFRAIE
ncbi:MAG: hypothetical protein V3T42_09115 [Nitrospirales bacterium]